MPSDGKTTLQIVVECVGKLCGDCPCTDWDDEANERHCLPFGGVVARGFWTVGERVATCLAAEAPAHATNQGSCAPWCGLRLWRRGEWMAKDPFGMVHFQPGLIAKFCPQCGWRLDAEGVAHAPGWGIGEHTRGVLGRVIADLRQRKDETAQKIEERTRDRFNSDLLLMRRDVLAEVIAIVDKAALAADGIAMDNEEATDAK